MLTAWVFLKPHGYFARHFACPANPFPQFIANVGPG